jgi:hypothetical protein
MIDGIYFTLPPGTLANCPFLLFTRTVEATGELREWREAHWGAFKIRVHNYSGRIEVRGSLHKYWSKSHNGGPFPRWAVAQAVQQLATALGFDPAQAVLHSFEFGANVPMPTPAKELLRRAVLSCKKGSPPKPLNTKYSEQGLMREVVAKQYYDKLYDKEQQLTAEGYTSPCPHLLRVEVKVRKMQLLHKAGVRTLADLSSPAALALMGELLLEHLNSILFAVPGNLPPTLRASQRRLLRDGATAGYWDRLAKQPQLRVQVRQYRIASQNVPDAALDAATQGLRSVWQQLLSEPAPALLVATLAEPNTIQLYPQYRGLTWNKEREEAAPSQTAEGLLASYAMPARLAADDDEREPTTAARCCRTCGRVLTSSSSRAKFCSERERGAAAKKCRNADSNPRNNAAATRRKTKSRGQMLFDDSPFVRVPEQYRAFVLAAA